ncbi:hypothetical protein Tco_1524497 [Tanacetum coccineum]
MTTLAKFMIIAGADNRPPMLDKSMCDSWKSRMKLYIENRENERMILNSVQNGPLVWPIIVQEDGITRTKKYEELSVTDKPQADCDLKATNIVLQGLPPDVYAIFNHHKVSKEIWDRVKLLMQGTKLSYKKGNTSSSEYKVSEQSTARIEQTCGCLAAPVFTQGDGLIACLYKAIAFLSVVAASSEGHMARQCTQPKRPRNAAWFKDKAMLAEAHESGQILDEEQLAFLADPGIPDGQVTQTTIPNNVAFQTEDLGAYDSDCDDVSNAKSVLMANLYNYGSDIISEVPHSEPYHNDMDNQSVHAMQDFEQTFVVDFPNNKITSDSNIILYSQYLQETQQAAIQDTNLYAPQDSMILSMI